VLHKTDKNAIGNAWWPIGIKNMQLAADQNWQMNWTEL
jgi:hypothetical protein